ncbi:MAG: RNA methyltransferase [Trueperaceae bacterium]
MRVILVRPQEPGNIGSAARVMKNFGLSDFWIVDPQCEIKNEAFWMATHAVDLVENAKIVATTYEAAADRTLVLGTTARVRASESFPIYTPHEAAEQCSREGLALMFGNEKYGLSNEDLEFCHAYIRIPTSKFSSLNLAQAVNLISYEFFVTHDKDEKPKGLSVLATREDLERVYASFLDSMRYILYADEEKDHLTQHMYRRIFDRARLTRREVDALHGLCRQIKWAVDNSEVLAQRRTEQFPDEFSLKGVAVTKEN